VRLGLKFIGSGVLGLIAFTSSCASAPNEPDEVSSAGLGTEAVHDAVEDRVELCMQEQGFDYERRQFIERTDFLEVSVRVPDAEKRGYGGVERGLQIGFRPSSLGAATLPAGMDLASGRQYLSALYGDEYLNATEHDHGAGADHDHDHGDADHTHDGVPQIGGCVAEGELYRQNVTPVGSLLDEDALLDLRDRLRSSPEYLEFSADWARCLRDSGHRPAANDPVGHTEEIRGYYLEAVSARFGQLASTQEGAELLSELSRSSSGAAEDTWLDEVAASDPGLADLLEQERAVAVADRSCRENLRALFDETYERLRSEADAR
jgi:hypothetical protein